MQELANNHIKYLLEFRNKLCEIDKNIISLLAERTYVSKQIAEIKSECGFPVIQPEYWKESSDNRLNLAKGFKISEQFIEKIFEIVHSESIRIQTEIIDRKESDA